MARRHENRCRGYEREARAAAALLVASPQPVLSLEAAPVFQSIWLTDGRPPALLTFYRSTCGRVTSTEFECTWHGVYTSSGRLGSWSLSESGQQMYVNTRYFDTDRLVSCKFVTVKYPDGAFWESLHLNPVVTLIDPIPSIIRVIRSGKSTRAESSVSTELATLPLPLI
jgi:hypothetical protein